MQRYEHKQTMYLSTEQKKGLEKKAQELRCDVSELMRRLINQHVLGIKPL